MVGVTPNHHNKVEVITVEMVATTLKSDGLKSCATTFLFSKEWSASHENGWGGYLA